MSYNLKQKDQTNGSCSAEGAFEGSASAPICFRRQEPQLPPFPVRRMRTLWERGLLRAQKKTGDSLDGGQYDRVDAQNKSQGLLG